MVDMQPGALVLEDGAVFPGRPAGSRGSAAGEICFTTAMAGYEEAVTDPSYAGQVLAFSYPLIGNYGVDATRMESARVWTEGIVARSLRPAFAAWLRAEGVVALEDVDTRAVVRHVRDRGAMRCALGPEPADALLERALAQPHLDVERGLAEGNLAAPPALRACTPRPYAVGAGPRVVVLDLGCKRSILRRLADAGVEAIAVPGTWDADAVLDLHPAAVLVGNGPGDPAQLRDAVETVRALLGRVPLYGICLGHQLVALALGLRTFKLPFGHRGANHPVRVTGSRRVLVTCQNHGFAVEPGGDVEITHVSLNDGTVEGLRSEDVLTLQFHPEAAPGPRDAVPFFDLIAAACRSAPTFAAS